MLSKPMSNSKSNTKYSGLMHNVYKTNANLYGRWCFINAFQIACNTKTLLQILWFKLPFPKLHFRINYKVLHIQKVKVKTFIAAVSFLLYFLFLLLFFLYL